MKIGSNKVKISSQKTLETLKIHFHYSTLGNGMSCTTKNRLKAPWWLLADNLLVEINLVVSFYSGAVLHIVLAVIAIYFGNAYVFAVFAI